MGDVFDALIRAHESGKTIFTPPIVFTFSYFFTAFSFMLPITYNFVSSGHSISNLLKNRVGSSFTTFDSGRLIFETISIM
jgi:hypothetical protein